MVFGAREHQIHMGIGQAEAIAISCGHDRSVPTFWALKETAPSRGCVGDNSRFAFSEVGEDVPIGTCMSGIITDHKYV